MDIYVGDFSDKESMLSNFEIEASALDNCEVIYAHYEGGYDGSAFVLFRKDGKLFEVNGSHCSCYGLEGQWTPEETTLAAMLARPNVPELAKKNLNTLYS